MHNTYSHTLRRVGHTADLGGDVECTAARSHPYPVLLDALCAFSCSRAIKTVNKPLRGRWHGCGA
jgi:hypothetical protein